MKFDIIPKRKMWFIISGAMVVLAILAILVFGLKVGIDFTGGTQLHITFEKAVPNIEELKQVFNTAVGHEKGEMIVATLDGKGHLIRARVLSESEVSAFASALSAKDWGASIDSTSTIGPTVGADIKKSAFIAVGLANLIIVLYLAFAFRRVPEGLSSWKFGLTAIFALSHDIVIVIGVFALLGALYGVEIDILFITALLTVLGFSVHDTIVIFDRIRENLKGEKSKKNLATVAEFAIWQSMRRSINTSLSVVIVITTILVFFVGFPSLFAFFLALLTGVVVGTYSSIFVAAPLLVVWHQKR